MARPLSVERIRAMRGEGMSNNQIIRSLQQEGYKSSEIFDALNQASIQRSEPSQPSKARESPPPVSSGGPSQQGLNSGSPGPAPMANPMPPPQRAPQQSSGGSGNEELIEAIIDEKWNDLLEDVNKIISWKDRTSQRVDQMDQQLKDLKDQFERLHQAVIGKVGEYDEHILQVGAEVKAMEKVFSKVLPKFTENVGELSRIADKMKKK